MQGQPPLPLHLQPHQQPCAQDSRGSARSGAPCRQDWYQRSAASALTGRVDVNGTPTADAGAGDGDGVPAGTGGTGSGSALPNAKPPNAAATTNAAANPDTPRRGWDSVTDPRRASVDAPDEVPGSRIVTCVLTVNLPDARDPRLGPTAATLTQAGHHPVSPQSSPVTTRSHRGHA